MGWDGTEWDGMGRNGNGIGVGRVEEKDRIG